MSTAIKLAFKSRNDAICASLNIESTSTLFVWLSQKHQYWMLTTWNLKDEEDAGGVWMGIRPNASISHKWLNNQLLTPEVKNQMAWNNPKGRAAAIRQHSGGDRVLDNYGDVIWEYITSRGANGEKFTNSEVVEFLRGKFNFTHRTAENYWRAFAAYCRAAPEDFSGPASRLTNIKSGIRNGLVWFLEDSPER